MSSIDNLNTTNRFERLCDRLRILSASNVVVLLVSALVILWRLALASPADPDLFARVGMGRLVDKLGYVPLLDPFAFTPKLPVWIDHEWLSGVVFYKIASTLGDAGLVLLKLVLSAWTVLLLVRASIRYAPGVSGRLLLVVVCVLESSYLWGSTIRCQAFTYFFIALVYFGFASHRANGARRYLALIPFVSVALVNMHGGYALLMAVLSILTVCAFIERRSWHYLLVVTAISSLAPFATPYGPEQFMTYLSHAITMHRPTIAEWSPLYSDLAGFARVAVIFTPLIFGVALTLKRRERDVTALALLGFSIYCGLSHIRFVGFATLTALVFGARYFSATLDFVRARLKARILTLERASAFVGSVAVVVMIAQFIAALSNREGWRLDLANYPQAAIEWLRESGANGRLLVDFNNGSLAQWRLFPRFLVSMDGRYEEVYRDDTVRDVALAFAADTPEGVAALRRIAPTHILFKSSPQAELAKAALPPEWREVYSDNSYFIMALNPESLGDKNERVKKVDLWEPLF